MEQADRNAIKAFFQHGFEQHSESGVHAVGDCIFCGSEKKFYINVKLQKWDCKKCGKSGGFQTFLKEIVDLCWGNFTFKKAKELSEIKGISIKTLRKHKVGYNLYTENYILPVFDANSEKVWDIRIYNNKKFMSTKGCSVGLYGWEQLHEEYDTIWLCEGEWDGIALDEALGKTKNLILSAPGANTFKAEWQVFFEGKNVRVLYDNDEAGKQGSLKVFNALKSTAKSLNFVHWEGTRDDGYDFRDLYIEEDNHALEIISSLMKNYPPGLDISKDQPTKKRKGKGLHHSEVYKRYQKWLYLPSTDVLDILYGTIIGNRLEGDPLWLFLVAESGGSKTELLISFSGVDEIYTTSSVTPKSLVSGATLSGGFDPSLIPRLDEKVLIIKDFTMLLEGNSFDRDEVFGILRDAYDGKVEKEYGNGAKRIYTSKFGLIAGVTPAIEVYIGNHASLGERFIKYKIPIDRSIAGEEALLQKAMDNTTKELTMREELCEVSELVLDYNFLDEPVISREINDKLLKLAQWTTRMRGTIMRDRYTKEVTHQAFMEIGTRLVKQYRKLLMGICMFKRLKKVTDVEYKLIREIAVGTAPSRLEAIVRRLYKTNSLAEYTISEISDLIGLPIMTTSRLVEDLHMLGVMNKEKLSNIKKNWRLNEEILMVMEIAEVYK